MHRLLYLLSLLCITLIAQGQNSAEIKGVVRDSTDGSGLIQATVRLLQNKTLITGTLTDEFGSYYLSGISPGEYQLEVTYTGYGTQSRRVKIKGGIVNYENFRLGESAIIYEGDATVYATKLFDTTIKIDVVGPPPFDAKVIQDLPARTITDYADLIAGAKRVGNQISVKGARPSATGYYLGTMPLLARINFSARSMSQFGLMLGGVAPEYGDFVGGAVVQNLVAVQTQKYFSAEVVSSSIFDAYHYNQVDLNFGGPLFIKKVKGDNLSRMVLGYHMNVNFIYQKDPSPPGIELWRVKAEKLKELEETPIRTSPVGSGFVPTAEFLTFDDLEQVAAREHASQNNLTWLGKLEYRPFTNLILEGAAVVNRQSAYIAPFSNQLLNSSANPLSTTWSVVSYLNLEHNLLTKLGEERVKRNQLRRMKYALSLQYQGVWNRTEDPVLKDDYFRYGYVGNFTAYRAPVYQYQGGESGGRAIMLIENGDTIWVKNYYELQGFADTLIEFDRSQSANPVLANYTSTYFDLSPKVTSFNQISAEGGGVLNGNNPIGIYSNMWSNMGTMLVGSSINSGVGRSQTEQFSINLQGELSKGIHTAKMGFYFEQRVSRAYSVNAMNLWDLMFQSANEGLGLDRENPIIHRNENGQFTDSVSYRETFNGQQTVFANRLRQRLMESGAVDAYGKPITPDSYINVHGLNPDMLSLDLFTADELLGTGGNNQYVSYFGYDYLGNRTRGAKGLNAFLNDPDHRNIGANRPIYTAMYVQDIIEINDLLIRAGVRVERFDANAPVLKDPYSLYPVRQAGEVNELNGNQVQHPEGVGSDYAVYVNDAKKPTQILGYRQGHQWYNADGIAISDPGILAQKSATGTIQPYLVDPENEQITAESFKDYQAKVMVLPRFSVDFPISSEARFFAYYDVLAQRPSNIFTPIDDYYFLRYNPTKVLNNPDLKPQITSDYEIGFRQLITRSSSLSLTASYREQRNMIQLVRYYQAYPVSYISYGNIDLSTIKGFRTEYQLNRLHFRMNASYTFQIAEGTGSGTGSQGSLISAGQPNLRNLFPLSFDIRHNIKFFFFHNFGSEKTYEGPVYKGRQLLANTGIGLTLNAFSGAPYTANALATPNAQSGIAARSPIKGTPNGSRLPWSLENNIRISRSFPVVMGKRDGKIIPGEFSLTLWVENFLNIQ
ncbi:MAG: carboxypeptidase regulatory-like domain-containing protein, partial [Bacteroidota bacterium]|nr:carboxypeptidase regulatory-like domain-containing protein [Bacteroidota bacterium]MDX5431080.1 carboxypeptidase regulatory-like domain-containing protein [Bacteroidota bacterium]MDX5469834.1 carboxypeptidase regulatory-like domain-containing protein [Bacteroidota bacterium]